jgi:hypothetical protein
MNDPSYFLESEQEEERDRLCSAHRFVVVALGGDGLGVDPGRPRAELASLSVSQLFSLARAVRTY